MSVDITYFCMLLGLYRLILNFNIDHLVIVCLNSKIFLNYFYVTSIVFLCHLVYLRASKQNCDSLHTTSCCEGCGDWATLEPVDLTFDFHHV